MRSYAFIHLYRPTLPCPISFFFAQFDESCAPLVDCFAGPGIGLSLNTCSTSLRAPFTEYGRTWRGSLVVVARYQMTVASLEMSDLQAFVNDSSIEEE